MEEQKKQFVQLIEQNKALIFKFCYMYANETETPDDLFQEVVINLWKGYPDFRGESKIQTWMYRISLNTCITFLRKSGKRPKTQALTDEQLEYTESGDMTSVRELYTLINKLNAFEKAIILLYLEDRSYDEIAQIVGITKSNVGVRINRIKEKLSQMTNNQKTTSMEIDEIKSIWSDMNARLEKNESLNKKILNEIMDNRHQTAKEKLMKYEVRYLILSAVFSMITPLYYFSGIFSLVGCILFAGLFVVGALWQVYKIVLLREMKMDVVSTTELLQKSLKFKIITRLRTIIGLSLMIPFFAIFLMVSPQLIKPEILTGMGVGLVVGLIIGLTDYFRNQKDIDKLINCYKDIHELKS